MEAVGAIAGVRLGEGLDDHGAVVAGGVEHAVGVEHEGRMAGPAVVARRREPDDEIAAAGVGAVDSLAEFGLLVRMAGAGEAAGVEGLLDQARAVGGGRRSGPEAVRHAEQAFGDGDGIGLEGADRGEVVGRHLGRVGDKGVQRQGGGDGGDPVGRQPGARLQGRGRNPADESVAAGAAPEPVALLVEDVEGLTENELVDALRGRVGAGVNVSEGHGGVHGANRPVGPGAHEPLQRLLGQVGPCERGAGIRRGGVWSQARLVRLSRHHRPICRKGR